MSLCIASRTFVKKYNLWPFPLQMLESKEQIASAQIQCNIFAIEFNLSRSMPPKLWAAYFLLFAHLQMVRTNNKRFQGLGKSSILLIVSCKTQILSCSRIFNANAPDAAIGNIQTFFMLFAAVVVYNMLEKPCIPIQIRGSVIQSGGRHPKRKGGNGYGENSGGG